MKKAALFLATLCPAAAFCQAAQPFSIPEIKLIKLIRLHYLQPSTARDLLEGSVTVTANNALKAIVIRADPVQIAQAEKLIRQLDVPPPEASARNVEVTVYVIGATDKPTPQAGSVPQNLEPVVRQLKGIFPYSTFALLDSMLVRSREGASTRTDGMLRDFPATPTFTDAPDTYTIEYDLLPRDASDGSRAIHFSKLHFIANERAVIGTAQAYHTNNTQVGFNTDLDLAEGQKVVVGKTDIDGGDAALFVVLSAKVE